MANYKVSYKMLAKQGDEIKAVCKLMGDYSERLGKVRGKVCQDQMLAEFRNNLQKLQTQMDESSKLLNMAGELLKKTVETYTGTEKRQVKKVDSLKAHNRDFYKNPVVVASAGGAAVGAAAATPAPTTTTTTVTYTDNSSVNYTQTTTAPEAAPVAAAPVVVEVSAPAAATAAPDVAQASAGNVAGIAAGAGVAGGALGTAAVLGVKHLMDEDKKDKPAKKSTAKDPDGYDPEKELAAAIERVRRLEKEG